MTATDEDRERVGPYRVIQAIGAGGSARIDLARIDRAYGFQRHVVLKRPLEHLRGNARVAASLRREARIGGQLRHPNLVAVLDAGIHDGYDYLVLEYVHGAALRAVMQAEAPGRVRELPLAVALAIVSDVARGMHEAHELTDDGGSPLGLVHRDVSPGNILLGLDGTVKLADFGIAKETRVSTLSGSLHGTVTYMAPEQCQGHAFDRRADIFSLGVILYELVTGTRLFWADNDVASLHRVLSGTVPRPREVKPQLPSPLEDLVMTAVAHDAGQRYPTALALAAALERYAADAGEVIGARWIARTMENVVGPKQVPWIAAATVPDPAPRNDGSLVELIAAAGPDEPLPASFGDGGEDLGLAVDPPSAPPPPLPNRAPGAPAGRTQRRRRALATGLVALTVIGGAAATALVMTRHPDTPATTAAPEPRQAPSTTAAAPPVTSPAPPVTGAGPPEHPVSPASGAASPGTADVAPAQTIPSPSPAPATADAPPPVTRAPTPATTAVKTRHRAKPAVPAPPRGPNDAKAADHTVTPLPAAAPATAAAESGSPQPAARPPANVEWKPTLLLPTDGSGARTPK